MAASSTLGWPDVFVALIAGLPAIIAAVAALLNRRALKTPSGETLGTIAERSHDLIAAGVAQNSALLKSQGVPDPNGLDKTPPVTPPPGA